MTKKENKQDISPQEKKEKALQANTEPTNRASNGKVSPTPKEKKFAQEYIATGNKTEAYRRSYNTKTPNKKSVQRMAVETSSKPQVIREIARLMELQGLTDELLIEKHMQGLSATKENGSEDYAVRHKYLDTAYKVKGHIDKDKESAPVQILFNIQ